MSFKVAAFYQFAALPDFRRLREPLRAFCAGLGLKGSILLAAEGINGTVAGHDDRIDALVAEFQQGELFGDRLNHLELKFSRADAMPFGAHHPGADTGMIRANRPPPAEKMAPDSSHCSEAR